MIEPAHAPVLEAAGLTKRYGTTVALDRVDFAVAAGEVFCLLGANGAGKTTAIHLFLGFTRPDAGTARVQGIDVAVDPLTARRRVAFVPEQVALYPTLSGLENLAYFAGLAAPARAGARDFLRVLDDFGLPETVARAPAATYSRGVRQRVGLAIAVARDARALLLDEPASGLDDRETGDLGVLLGELAAAGLGVLLVEHDVALVMQVCADLSVLNFGQVIASGTPTEVQSNRAVLDAYLGGDEALRSTAPIVESELGASG